MKKILAIIAILAIGGTAAFAAEADKKNENSQPKIEGKMPQRPDAEKGNPGGKKMFPAMPGMERGMMHENCPMHGKGMGQHGKKMEMKKEDGNDRKKAREMKKDRKGGKGFFAFKRGGFPFGGPDKKWKNNELKDKEVISMVKDADSSFAKQLNSLKKDSPRQYEKAMKTLAKRLVFLKGKKDDKAKEMINKTVASVKAQTEVSSLLEKYRKAPADKKEEIKAMLKASLENLFELKVQEQQSRIQGMEEALAAQKKQLDEKKANKTRIVESRLEEITGAGFKW